MLRTTLIVASLLAASVVPFAGALPTSHDPAGCPAPRDVPICIPPVPPGGIACPVGPLTLCASTQGASFSYERCAALPQDPIPWLCASAAGNVAIGGPGEAEVCYGPVGGWVPCRPHVVLPMPTCPIGPRTLCPDAAVFVYVSGLDRSISIGDLVPDSICLTCGLPLP